MEIGYIKKYLSRFFVSYFLLLLAILFLFYFLNSEPSLVQMLILPSVPSIFISYLLTNRYFRIKSLRDTQHIKTEDEIIDEKIDSIYFRTYKSAYWYLGFGWPSITILFIIIGSYLITSGTMRIIIATLGTLFLLFITLRSLYWNFPKWKRIHGRGMLLYSEIMGYELGLSKTQNREYDHQLALDLLARKLSNQKEEYGFRFFAFMAMKLRGQLYVEYFMKHIVDLNPNISHEIIYEVEKELIQYPLSPCMVIVQLIDKKYGSLEAAKYVVALYEGKAR